MTDRNLPWIEIAGRRIGAGHAPYVIAEVGINHGGDAGLAEKLVLLAAEAGADAVKLQAFRTELFLSPSSQYFGILKSAELEPEALARLATVARKRGIVLISSVFDEPSADTVAALGMPAFKIASGDLNNLPLLRHVAKFGRPMLLSSGGGTIGEIETALAAVREVSPDLQIAVFHCVSHYPTKAEDANLAAIAPMLRQLGIPTGFSDHTVGTAGAVAAVALGASIIEKHFTHDREAPGPDHQLSSDPAEFRRLCADVKIAYAAIGSARKAPVETQSHIQAIRRSPVAIRAIRAGERITSDMIAIRRPGTGLAPDSMGLVLSATARRDVPAGTILSLADLDIG